MEGRGGVTKGKDGVVGVSLSPQPPAPSRWRPENGAACAGCGGGDTEEGAGENDEWGGLGYRGPVPGRPRPLFLFFLFSVSVLAIVLQMLGLKCTFIK